MCCICCTCMYDFGRIVRWCFGAIQLHDSLTFNHCIACDNVAQQSEIVRVSKYPIRKTNT